MKLWKIAAAALCLCFLFSTAYAANAGGAGSADDPLVTLSYLNGAYTSQVREMVDQAVIQRQAEMERSLRDLLNGQAGSITPPTGDAFVVVTLTQGQSLVGDVGCEVMLRVGSATCGSGGDTVGLIDTTSGLNLGDGQPLATNHLYMVTISTRTVTAASSTVKVLARGAYTVQ